VVARSQSIRGPSLSLPQSPQSSAEREIQQPETAIGFNQRVSTISKSNEHSEHNELLADSSNVK